MLFNKGPFVYLELPEEESFTLKKELSPLQIEVSFQNSKFGPKAQSWNITNWTSFPSFTGKKELSYEKFKVKGNYLLSEKSIKGPVYSPKLLCKYNSEVCKKVKITSIMKPIQILENEKHNFNGNKLIQLDFRNQTSPKSPRKLPTVLEITNEMLRVQGDVMITRLHLYNEHGDYWQSGIVYHFCQDWKAFFFPTMGFVFIGKCEVFGQRQIYTAVFMDTSKEQYSFSIQEFYFDKGDSQVDVEVFGNEADPKFMIGYKLYKTDTLVLDVLEFSYESLLFRKGARINDKVSNVGQFQMIGLENFITGIIYSTSDKASIDIFDSQGMKIQSKSFKLELQDEFKSYIQQINCRTVRGQKMEAQPSNRCLFTLSSGKMVYQEFTVNSNNFEISNLSSKILLINPIERNIKINFTPSNSYTQIVLGKQFMIQQSPKHNHFHIYRLSDGELIEIIDLNNLSSDKELFNTEKWSFTIFENTLFILDIYGNKVYKAQLSTEPYKLKITFGEQLNVIKLKGIFIDFSRGYFKYKGLKPIPLLAFFHDSDQLKKKYQWIAILFIVVILGALIAWCSVTAHYRAKKALQEQDLDISENYKSMMQNETIMLEEDKQGMWFRRDSRRGGSDFIGF